MSGTGTIVYDADCGFCTRTADWVAAHGRATIQPWQTLDLAAHGLTVDDVTQAAYWLDDGGRVTARGAGAAAEALKTCRLPWRPLGYVVYARPVRPLADVVYAWVARNRHRMPGSTDACRL
jgi:predicted DCC family thiol-disulfide oxidoreductase YuxK